MAFGIRRFVPYKTVSELYKDMDGAEIEKELTAELVGEYLFGDENFVKNLSANKSLFKKVYDEIKYLAKQVLPGSKEAKDIDRIKRLFEKAYAEDVSKQKSATGTGDAMFADGKAVLFSLEKTNISESKEILRIINENIEKIPFDVFDVTYNDDARRYESKIQYVLDIFDEQGNTATNLEIGKIELVRSGAKSTVMHGYGNLKLSATKAIKPVLEQGKIISVSKNYQGKGYDRYIVAAKGKINGVDTLIGAVVKSYPNAKSDSKFYLHEAEIVEANLSSMTAPQLSVDTVNKSASTDTIPQTSADVNSEFSDSLKYSISEDVQKVEQHFGTTYKISEAGYLLTDGKLLDFSGKHNGAPGGYRTVDHRDVADAFDGEYGDGTYSGSMIRFMQDGNIRLSPESGGINLSVKPNNAQLQTLDRYITHFRGEVTLDIDDANGNTVVSIEYPKRTYSKRIIDDIKAYFDNGTVPQQPSHLGQFRYSLSGETGAREGDQRYVLEEAKNMERNGVDSEEIRSATGWFRGYDGKWRIEVDDSEARFTEEELVYTVDICKRFRWRRQRSFFSTDTAFPMVGSARSA